MLALLSSPLALAVGPGLMQCANPSMTVQMVMRSGPRPNQGPGWSANARRSAAFGHNRHRTRDPEPGIMSTTFAASLTEETSSATPHLSAQPSTHKRVRPVAADHGKNKGWLARVKAHGPRQRAAGVTKTSPPASDGQTFAAHNPHTSGTTFAERLERRRAAAAAVQGRRQPGYSSPANRQSQPARPTSRASSTFTSSLKEDSASPPSYGQRTASNTNARHETWRPKYHQQPPPLTSQASFPPATSTFGSATFGSSFKGPPPTPRSAASAPPPHDVWRPRYQTRPLRQPPSTPASPLEDFMSGSRGQDAWLARVEARRASRTGETPTNAPMSAPTSGVDVKPVAQSSPSPGGIFGEKFAGRRPSAAPSAAAPPAAENAAQAERMAVEVQSRVAAEAAELMRQQQQERERLKQERLAAASEMIRKEQAAAAEARAAADELMKERAAAEEARAAAEELKERVEAAEARAVAAEEYAKSVATVAAVAEERAVGNSTEASSAGGGNGSVENNNNWLVQLAGGEFGMLGNVEVLSVMSQAAVAARASAETLDDAMVKRVWLKSLDVPTWGQAAVALSEAASEAAEMAEFEAMCAAGDGVSCRILSEQEESTELMMAQLNVSSWGEAAGVLSAAASDAAAVSATALQALESFGFLKHRHAGGSSGGFDMGFDVGFDDDD